MLSRVSRPIVVGAGLIGVTAALAGCSAPAAENRSYTDGIYAAGGGYSSPGGPQGINVAVQLKDDEVAWVIVTPSSFVGEAGRVPGRASPTRSDFEVEGKDIDLIAVSRVAGSSLTSLAFNDALEPDQDRGRRALIEDPLPHAWTFDAIGVPWRIDTRDALTEPSKAAIADRIERFDRDWSRFREDSLVTRISQQPGRYRLPDDAGPLLDLYRQLYEVTGGRVSPLVGRALESLGYDRSYGLRAASVREGVPAWDDAIAWDGEYLETVTPVLLDVGAVGKGYLIDLVSGVLAEQGFAEHVVDASGDLLARGEVRMRVALEHPRDPKKAIGVVELHDGALAASASNRRAWGDGLHHVLDAVTGEPTGSVDRVLGSGRLRDARRRRRDGPLLRAVPGLGTALRNPLRQNVRQRSG